MTGRLVPAPEPRTKPLPYGNGKPAYSGGGKPATVIATAKRSGGKK